MSQNFAIFSNTIGEFEIFVRSNTVYWPSSVAKLTPSQKKLGVLRQEQVGDTVFLVSLGEIKDNSTKDFKDKITASPMITHRGHIVDIVENPVLCYRYSHGKRKTKKYNVMLAFEMFETLKDFETFLDEPFTNEDKKEIDMILKVSLIIKSLQHQIKFVRAYEDGDSFIISGEADEFFILDKHKTPISAEDEKVSGKRKLQMMPDKESLTAIKDACDKDGLNGEEVILNLGTKQGKQYLKIKLTDELFQPVNFKGRPSQGISTRVLTYGDSQPFVSKLYDIVSSESISNFINKENKRMDLAKNQILFGPPGTGKTYSVVRKALEIVNPKLYRKLIEDNADRNVWMKEYKKYIKCKQIQFCTFHQSYSYEDFVEGLRSDSEGNFIPTNGIFLDICKEARESCETIVSTYEFDVVKTNFYKISLGRKVNDDEIYRFCIENNVISIGFGDDLDFSDCNSYEEIKELIEESYKGTDKKDTVLQAVSYFKHFLEIDDVILVSNGNSHIRAIGRVVGEYKYDKETEIRFNHFRKVEWLYKGEIIPIEEILNERKFMMRSIYKLDKENLNLDFIQKFISTFETPINIETKNYVLIMDEINRANISRVFGELITLIEEDKRLGEENELEVKLPYSRKPFGVPSNLYLIGTMNTADRSITLLDTALRRRFDFIEMLPEIALLPEDVDGVNVKELVQTINQRIEYLYDRDHTIGHAFFLKEELSGQKLINIMHKKVIPLLQEYFYDDWEKIELVLGGATSNGDLNYFIKKETIEPANIFIGIKNNQLEELEKQIKYYIVSNPNKQALINIYKGQNSQ
ncbi:AAA family ATPase [Gottfriedia acidiceleris]|uniref:AAA family ATPase n=1 Tax=Gottfriedia acidiceleris TaxID=371036 RepID=UPI002FFEFE74